MVTHTTTGVAVAIGRLGTDQTGVVGRMLARLAHRGPDLSAAVRRTGDGLDAAIGYVGMVNTPDDLSAWRPPQDPGAGSVLVMDGFIANLDAVSNRLRAAGVNVTGLPLVAVINHALAQWGDSVIDSLHGQFALVHYDAPRRRILLARDPLGTKPLYWAPSLDGTGLVVASEIRAILASGQVDQAYDATGIASYLAYGYSHAPQTIHRNIQAIPAGCWLEFRLHGGRTLPGAPVPYWHLPAVAPPLDENAEIERLRDALGDAVTGLCTGLPTASTYLPGDVESAVLAVMTNRCLPELRTAFIDVESPGLEERARLAAAVADELKARHFQMIIDEEWGSGLWMDWLTSADNPCIDGYDTYVVSQAIKDTGAVAAVFPTGGVELLRGSPSFAMTARLVEIAAMVKKTPRWLRTTVRERIALSSSPLHRGFVRDACGDGETPMTIALHARRIFRNADLLHLGFGVAVAGLGNVCLPTAVRSTIPVSTGDLFADLTRLQCRVSFPNRTMLACDNGGMANSLDIRLPYATRRVTEALLVMPGRLLSPKPSRAGLAIRNVASGMLPYNMLVRQEPRPRFQFTAWMSGSLRSFAEQCVAAVAACPVVDGDSVLAMWRRILEHAPIRDAGQALTLVALGAVMRQHNRENLT
jgi:asparagine synthase (glutamine-hydrolysing)